MPAKKTPKVTPKARSTRFRAVKKLSFIRPNAEGGEKVIKRGDEFTPDDTMNIDQMLKSGKIEEA